MCDALLRRGVPDRTHAMNTFDLTKVVRPNIQKLKPYRCARDDYSDGQLMDANENSLGPPMNVDIIDAPERYPCPHQRELKTLYAKWRGVEPKQVFLGVGSDEAIDLLVRMACTPGKDSILTLPPTYGMYGVCAQVNDVNVVKVPLEDGFMMNTKKVLSVIENQPKQSPIKLVFVCHPNNPTGIAYNNNEIEQVAKIIKKYNCWVFADEIYLNLCYKEKVKSISEFIPELTIIGSSVSKDLNQSVSSSSRKENHPIYCLC